MNKHTPGPWDRIIADGYTVRHPQIYSDTGPVANATWLGDGRLDELNANAKLIAAAPDLLKQRDELLAALQDALGDLEYLKNAPESAYARPDDETIKAARAAIAKAGGAV